MNPEQQRIAIAEACGWTAKEDKDGFWRAVDASGNMTHELWMSERNVWSAGIPDYLNDLNAMHEAERVLTYNLTRRFEDHLCDICKRSNDEKEDPAPWRLFFAVVNATASQRAEAFLRTIGTWEESK